MGELAPNFVSHHASLPWVTVLPKQIQGTYFPHIPVAVFRLHHGCQALVIVQAINIGYSSVTVNAVFTSQLIQSVVIIAALLVKVGYYQRRMC